MSLIISSQRCHMQYSHFCCTCARQLLNNVLWKVILNHHWCCWQPVSGQWAAVGAHRPRTWRLRLIHTLNLLLLSSVQCTKQLVCLIPEVLTEAPECSAYTITLNFISTLNHQKQSHQWCHSTCQATWTPPTFIETMASEAASLGLELNCQKTKVLTLGSRKDEPSTITVLVAGGCNGWTEKFVYLGSLVHSSTQSSSDISRRNAITHAAMQNPDNQMTDLEVKNFHFYQAKAV